MPASGSEEDRQQLLEELVYEPVAVEPLGAEVAATGAIDVSAREILRQQWRLVLRMRSFQLGAAILLLWVVGAVLGGGFAPYSPYAQNLLATNAAPSAAHWLGTDNLGRDVLSRVINGSRDVLIIAPLATLVAIVLGTALGLVQGFYRGTVDVVASRLVEALLALPTVIVAFLFIVAVGPSRLTLIMVIGLAFGLVVSRTVRTAVLQERELDYVAAAKLRGESGWHTMFVEMLPNVLSPIIVEGTIRLGWAIFAVADLSFLGFGVQPPTPDWGADIAANYQYLSAGYWWETLFPALAVISLITAINLVGDAMEQVLIQ